MGMHFGTIATTGAASDLLAALSSAGSFRVGRQLASFDDVPETDAAGERSLIAGEHEGRAYLLDDSLILSTDPDLIVDASRRLGRRIFSTGAETTSGTYWLIVADSGRLERFHWNGLGAQTEPYDVGQPLAGEPTDGLDDVDGRRLMGILAAAGFDPDAWRDRGAKVLVEATYGEPPSGPASEAMAAFLETHAVPGSERINPVVIDRGDGDFDLAAPGSRLPDGTRTNAAPTKPGLLGRLFGRG